MKVYSLKSLLIIDFLALFLFISYYFSYGTHLQSVSQKQVLANNGKSLTKIKETISPLPGSPIHLTIPAINVNTNIQPLGITPQGDMEAPESINDVGWFKFGPAPGEIGSAVIAGHFNGKDNQIGVFANLNKLKKGDQLFVINEIGTSTTFIVQSSRLYDPGYAENIFSSNDKAHLNLITCDGTWDKIKQTYSKRLVILADIVN